jgi:tRNA(His) guanylyltransferase
MKFDELDQMMRKYEQSLDVCVPPELYLAVRLDGRSFTRLTKEICPFEAPFDPRFRGYMVGTVRHLMDCGFHILYGYTESDEISLLFHPQENAFGRKTRKLNSILAGEASAAFTAFLGRPAAFDCRVVPLPTLETVQDYFLWRQEDADRNALNAHCYWLLRKEGQSAASASRALERQSAAWKNELLLSRGISYDDLPAWQKRGVGLWWESALKEGYNPVSGQTVAALRRELHEEYELPLREEYAKFLTDLLRDIP